MCNLIYRPPWHLFLTLLYVTILLLNNLVKGLLVEETSHFTLTCPKDVETLALNVSYADGQNETLAIFKQSGCTVYQPGIVCYNFINTDKVVISPVTVRSRTIIYYSCNSVNAWNITFYAKPSNISCARPSLDGSGLNVLVTCRTSKIFPQAGCTYFDMTNSVSIQDPSPTLKLESGGSPVYYSAECSLKLPVSKLTPGSLQMQVLLYPVMELGVNYGVNTTITPDVILEPLNISLDSSCLQGPNTINGYIKGGTEVTCTCLKTSNVDVIGHVNWYTGNTVIGLNETDPSNSTLTLSYPKDHNKTFQCRAIPLAVDPYGIGITPVFGFGPSQVYATSNEVIINVCPNSMTTTRISCWAPRSDVNPDVTIDLSTDRPDIVKTSIGPDSSISSPNRAYIITVSASKGGRYTMNCSLINTVFIEFHASKSIAIVAREAPKEPPVFVINGGQPIKEGITSDMVNFTCSAPAGYPAVSNLTIICLGQTIFVEGTYWSIKMALSREVNGSMCTCTAHHESGCYLNDTTKRFINITYNVNITHFTGNNATEIEVQKGDIVHFVCAAESNPKPNFTLQTKVTDRRRLNNFTVVMNTIETAKNNWQAEYIWNDVRCEDTNTYTCVTENLYYDVSVEQSMKLYVKCPFQVLNDSLGGNEFQTAIGEDAVITIELFGHPKPTLFELFKGIKMSAVGIEKYNVTFVESISPYGSVTLTLKNLQNNDMTLYTLIVRNGVDSPLQYRFLLEKASESPSQDDVTTSAIIGGVLGGVIMIIFTCIAIFICRKKKCCCSKNNP